MDVSPGAASYGVKADRGPLADHVPTDAARGHTARTPTRKGGVCLPRPAQASGTTRRMNRLPYGLLPAGEDEDDRRTHLYNETATNEVGGYA